MTSSAASTNVMSFMNRALIALLFIPYGIEKVFGFDRTVQYITNAHVPFPEVCAMIGIFAELVLGSLLLIGWQTRWVALALVIYAVVLAFVFHAFWGVPPARAYAEKLNFFKDLAIAGGLLGIAAWGAGGWSLDASTHRRAASPNVPAL